MASDHRQGKCKYVWYKIGTEDLHVLSFPILLSVGQSADDTLEYNGGFYNRPQPYRIRAATIVSNLESFMPADTTIYRQMKPKVFSGYEWNKECGM